MNKAIPITSAPKRINERRKPKFKPIDNTVIALKSRTNEIIEAQEWKIMEWAESSLEQFIAWVGQYFSLWISSATLKEREELMVSAELIWNLVCSLEYEKDYFLYIFYTDFSRLDVDQRFHFTFIQFLYNPMESQVIKNLKRCIRDLIKENPESSEYKILYKNLSQMLEATIYLRNTSKINCDLSYLGNVSSKLT